MILCISGLLFDKAAINCHSVYSVWRECLQRSQEVIALSQDMLYFHVLFKSREIRAVRTKMPIVFFFPAVDAVALGEETGGLKSQGGREQ